MHISRKKVFEYLSRCQGEKGGYTGRNIGELAKKLSVSIESRKHVFVEGVNVCNLLRDTGKLVLWNEGQKNFQIDDFIQLIETRKWKTKKMEGCYTLYAFFLNLKPYLPPFFLWFLIV